MTGSSPVLPVVSKSRRGLFMQRKRKAKRGVKERMASWGILVACFVGAFWTVTDWAAEFKADVAAGAHGMGGMGPAMMDMSPFDGGASGSAAFGRALLNATAPVDPCDVEGGTGFPRDAFLDKYPYRHATNKGWLVLHFIGMLYMFIGLAIVCDDFFVGALEIISKQLDISEDVAGATLMAAGGSMPEFFTSIVGVFFSEDDVGFGCIVGSAVFNVLFVIACCAVFAHEPLELTWWPLFRDATYYVVSLGVLTGFIFDGGIEWWEALLLFLMYFGYVTLMAYNEQLQERALKWASGGRTTDDEGDDGPDAEKGDAGDAARSGSAASTASTASTSAVELGHEDVRDAHQKAKLHNATKLRDMKSIALRMMMRGKGGDEAGKLAGVASGLAHMPPAKKRFAASAGFLIHQRRMQEQQEAAGKGQDYKNVTDVLKEDHGAAAEGADRSHAEEVAHDADSKLVIEDNKSRVERASSNNAPAAGGNSGLLAARAGPIVAEEEAGEEEEEDEGHWLDVPETLEGKIFWAICLPIQAILRLTLPNVTDPEVAEQCNGYMCYVTFFGALIWIAIFTYVMVWCVATWGTAFGISTAVLGITLLAAGTSIPDAISSVIVARQGFGDMAVSSSIGSNIFDILFGLPVPWLLKTGIVTPGFIVSIGGCEGPVSLVISVITLLLMVVLVIGSIMYVDWVLGPKLGAMMGFLYVIFLAQSIYLLQYPPLKSF